MGDIVVFRNGRAERTWVPKADEDYWIRFWQRGGYPAARWSDYERWGGFFPPLREISGYDVLRRPATRVKRKRTNYARWTPPKAGY